MFYYILYITSLSLCLFSCFIFSVSLKFTNAINMYPRCPRVERRRSVTSLMDTGKFLHPEILGWLMQSIIYTIKQKRTNY